MNRPSTQADAGDNSLDGAGTPAFVISIPLEGRPRIQLVALHYEEEVRLRDWVEADRDRYELVAQALKLAGEELAA
jgi:hypothetical protein